MKKPIKSIIVEFKVWNLIDEETLQSEYKGDIMKFLKYIWKEENMGITDDAGKVIGYNGIII